MAEASYSIRRFTPADIAAYKSIRLEALQLEPGMFGRSFAEEGAYPESTWADRLINPDSACFGLYAGEELIGLTGIFREADKPEEAYMTQSYIRKAYRGLGLSSLLYDVRIKWANEHGIQRLTIGHRRSNTASYRANQRYGFSFTHSMTRTWPDGGTEDMLYYELALPDNSAGKTHE